MTVSLHNTLTGDLDVVKPINQKQVTMYTCGPTVYHELTVGNWVAYVRWDVLVRTLLTNGYTVNRTMNITDVGHLVSDADEGEDKMIKGARREGVTEWEVADRYTNAFLEGMTSLNLLPPEHLTKATEHIDIQIQLIEQLENNGYTYVIDDGVYFDTTKFPRYADFAHLNLDAQKAGARVTFNNAKRSVSDFVLWRLTPHGESRSMEWDSPWGRGIPGWHIECSAMAMHYLGKTIDIHTGGIDHIPVHHTNEIAQSEAATGVAFANTWVHTNFLLVNGTKISKSLGNGYTLTDLTKKGFSPDDFRMFTLQSHYRTESNFTWDNLESAAMRFKRWRSVAVLRHQPMSDTESTVSTVGADTLELIEASKKAMNDDLNSPRALSILDSAFDLYENRLLTIKECESLTSILTYVTDAFGLDLLRNTSDVADDIKSLIEKRLVARQNKNWSDADSLRDELTGRGVGLNDSSTFSTWHYL